MYQQRKRLCNFWQNRLENRDFLAGEGREKGGQVRPTRNQKRNKSKKRWSDRWNGKIFLRNFARILQGNIERQKRTATQGMSRLLDLQGENMEETEGDGRWTDNKLGQVGNRERCFSLEEIRNGIYWNHTRARCFDVTSFVMSLDCGLVLHRAC